TSAADLVLADGVVRRASGAGATMTVGEVVAAMARSGERAFAEASFESSHMVYPYGVHVAQVCVDRQTGQVKVERYLVAYDIGRAVNPMLVEGQITGGVAQ